MNKIINGKRYDTEKAQLVGKWNNQQYGSFSYISESLYRKRTGEFFLHGEGGPMTRYAEVAGENSWASGERLVPIGYADAQAWAEEHLTGDDYEAVFGEVTDDDTETVFAVRLPKSTVEEVKRAANSAGLTISAYVEGKLSAK